MQKDTQAAMCKNKSELWDQVWNFEYPDHPEGPTGASTDFQNTTLK
jgi:hypothetical protein